IQDIDDSGNDIIAAYAALNGKLNELAYRMTRPEEPIDTNSPTRTLVVNYVRIKDLILAYYMLVDLVPEISSHHVVWRSVRIIPGKIRPVRSTAQDFANFVEQARTETNVNMFLVQRSPEGASPTTA